jgi:predicted ATPase
VLLGDPACRLLTLIGPGGSGKTRLALEAAAAQVDANVFRDGIFFVALAALQSAAGIESAVAEAIGFSFLGLDRQSSTVEHEPRQQLLDYLRQKQMLLVLDNFEHLLEGVDLVTEILEAAPGAKILVTSRERLNVGGEHRYQVGGMDYPTSPCTVEEAMQYSAISLFVQGARRAQRGFQLKERNLDGVVQICLLTGGMPLAVRLAAAWTALLSPADIASQLSHGLDLLETKRRDVPERQRSLRAAFEHSWDLLAQREREVFQALSVFRGGFSRGAAQFVSGASLLELLALADKSLLDGDGATRFQIHRSLQQFAAEKLEQDPAVRDSTRDRHCAFFASALQSWEAGLKGHRQGETLGEMDQEIENARAAWQWATEHRQVERLDQALDALAFYYESRLRLHDGEYACRLAAAALGDERPAGATADANALRVLARVLAMQAGFCWHMGDARSAGRLLDQSLASLSDRALSGKDTRREQALLAFQRGLTAWGLDWEQCRGHFEHALELYRALGDRWWEARILEQVGAMSTYIGMYDDAARWYTESLKIRRNIGDRAGIASSLNEWGSVVYLFGDFEEGIKLNRECIQISRELGHRQGIGRGLNQLGPGLTLMGQFTESLSVLAESVALWAELGVDKFRNWHTFWRGMAEMHLGKYKVADSLAEQVLTSARGARQRPSIASAFWLLGDAELAAGQPEAARECFAQSIAIYREYGLPNEMAIVLGEMVLALVHLGQASEAAETLLEALQIIRQGGAIASFIHVLPGGALLEAAVGAPELAAEFYALASRYPYVVNSRWYEDVVGKHIAAAAAALPPEVVAAAQERGRARDLWETVDELLGALEK